MGKASETKDQTVSFDVKEKGEIYFFFKPKVGVEEPHSGDDVQSMFFVLRPQAAENPVEEKQTSDSGKEGKLKEAHEEAGNGPDTGASKKEATEAEHDDKKPTEKTSDEEKNGHKSEKVIETEEGDEVEKVEIGEKPLFRYIVMGRKSLPDKAKGKSRPYWGYVELVTTNPEDLKAVLSEEEYDTKTLGHRVNPAARPVGEGRYSIVQHHQGNRQPSTHLVYKLERPGPHKKHDPQDAMNIEPQASFVIQVKNPKQPTPPGARAGSKRPALLPAKLLGQLGTKRFVPLDPPDILNYEGVEFILISTDDELLDEEVDEELETSDNLSSVVPDIMALVVMSKDHEKLIRPLIEGVWS